MTSRLLSHSGDVREWILVMDAGDEAMAELQRFAAENDLSAAHFTEIGAFSSVTVAWFDLRTRKCLPVKLSEQVEVLSLIGDIVHGDDAPSVRAHACVALSNATAHGGHLVEGRVNPTLEVILGETAVGLRKTFRPEFGVALIDPSMGAVPQART